MVPGTKMPRRGSTPKNRMSSLLPLPIPIYIISLIDILILNCGAFTVHLPSRLFPIPNCFAFPLQAAAKGLQSGLQKRRRPRRAARSARHLRSEFGLLCLVWEGPNIHVDSETNLWGVMLLVGLEPKPFEYSCDLGGYRFLKSHCQHPL